MSLFRKSDKSDMPRRRMNAENSDSIVMQADTFKRNRTLTGSTSNSLNSFGGSDADFVSTRKHVHHLTNQRRKISAVLLPVIGAIIILWFIIDNLTAAPAVGFYDLTISKKIDNTRYEDVISDYLDSNPLSRFHFVMNEQSLLSYVVAKLPEVSAIYQKGNVGLGVTKFEIVVRQPIAAWKISNHQYYVDSLGVSFEKNYYIDPSVQIVDNSGISAKSGEIVASKRFLSFVGKVVAYTKTSGYTVTQAIIPPDTTRQLQIKLKEVGYPIKLSIDRPAGEQVEDMCRAVKYLVSNNKTPSYVDVRVSGKAFYK